MAKAFVTPYNSTDELLQAVATGKVKSEDIKAHLDSLEIKTRKGLTIKRSEKKKDRHGAFKICISGLQKFPVTLSEENWRRVFAEGPALLDGMLKDEAEAAKAAAEKPVEPVAA